jgi:Stress responsive A/B Barrel Domain
MIHHVVMWRLRDEAKRTQMISITDQLQRNVEAMRSAVPGLLRLELAANRASVPDAADLLLYSEFESWHALQGYEVHPLHDELRGLIAPLRIERRVVDYET